MSDSPRSLFRKIVKGEPSQPASPALPDQKHVPPDGPAQPSVPCRPVSPPAPKRDTPVPSLIERVRPDADTPPLQPEPGQRGFKPEPLPAPLTYSDARLFLQQLRGKMARLAEEFAQGKLNSKQFQEIYAHYQKQRTIIEATMEGMADSKEWQKVVAPGQTAVLRQSNAATVLSYAIYDNASSLPLACVGDFAIDTALLIPMLSSFRSATAEMFGAGLRSTQIEGGRWLCFVPGKYSTLFVIFSLEPARLQLALIEDLHRDFEVANRAVLESGQGEEVAQEFANLWALDRDL